MRRTIEQFIEELRHGLIVAGLNYEIWWVYKEKNSRKRYAGTMNAYSPFFQTGIHAHFVAYLVAIYRIYEKRKNTLNIPRLLDMVEKSKRLPHQALTDVKTLYNEAKPLWLKVFILRNSVFGHRSEALDVTAAFRKADVTPNELKRLITITKKLLNKISLNWDRSAHVFEFGSGEAAKRLLEDLRTLHNVP